jgi:hypothetical protein
MFHPITATFSHNKREKAEKKKALSARRRPGLEKQAFFGIFIRRL